MNSEPGVEYANVFGRYVRLSDRFIQVWRPPHEGRLLKGRAGRPRLSWPGLLSRSRCCPGCMVGPKLPAAERDRPSGFPRGSGAVQQSSFADLPWWRVFRDDSLQELIRTSLANNYDLAVAAARVEQARRVAAQARSQYFPAIGYVDDRQLRP